MLASLLERVRAIDPRIYQMTVQATLLTHGMLFLDFDLGLAQVAVTIGTALMTQWIACRVVRVPFELYSAANTSLSLCLILRTNFLWCAALAALLAIGSKFVIRYRGKHVFNPSPFALVALLAVGAPIWVSPGQWGNAALTAFLIASAGSFVVTRSLRADIAFGFLAFWACALFGRALYLGDPLSIPIHQLESGMLILFSFAMMTDPKTTPDSRIGRLIFAALVALGGYWIQFVLYRTNGLLWSLCAVSLAVPIIDRLMPGVRFAWAHTIRRPEPVPAE
ncbi:MAG: RnfABCDGE type electron transport complex subunit D [Deltaproteobacteria bacterium]|nr:RnfABCDGE type electron transport complex subunit D [Deltaproteobacteria bacterium]